MYSFGPIAAAMSLLSTILSGLAAWLTPLTAGLSFGLAVVLLTVVVRLVLVPLGVAQVRAEKARARIAPRLAAITAEHRNDPQRLVAEQRKAYEEAGTSPLAGCMPALLQMPVVIALYGVFIGAGGVDEPLLTHTFAGVELGATMLGGAEGLLVAPVFAVLVGLIALVAWANRRYLMLPMMRANAAAAEGRPPVPGVLTYLQFVTVVVAVFVPLAAVLYLLTSTSWALGERLVLRRILPD
ncbi:YidC/Oxa1 family membrane protein insertase [Nocardiopsis aegyptia]|uniref:Membrane protein insertase YidC n=1 Tax=Nocardiopsis aegyptia TaxID=220378 RepID=A0A7Z0EP46_9ACTN|nr:membrane protein insertase YidC [Nocardiopsis aegyptia]NYJ35651.1 YidC/Oxa1 family membrane protein insertase [Nocardiopsis aegyptia]